MVTKFIVSCQAEKGSPFNDINSLIKFAQSAKIGGANGIRSEGVFRTKKIINTVSMFTIGLVKKKFNDNTVAITTYEKDFEKLLKIGCDVIAVDGTSRIRSGMTGHQFIGYLKKKYKNCKIMADISTLEEGINCSAHGADFISTTLNGYTPWTIEDNNSSPNYDLIKKLIEKIDDKVVAEGRISNVDQAKKIASLGCSMIVVGSSITRPHLITNNFVESIKK